MRNVQVSVALFTASAVITLTSIIGLYLYRKKSKKQPPTTWREVGKVQKLHIYPLKSGRRVEVNSAECTIYGIKQTKDDEKTLQLRDRSFVVYDAKAYDCKTARTFPKMVLIEVSVHDETHVAFDAPGMRSLYVKLPSAEKAKSVTIGIHNEQVHGLDCGEEAASWISRYIYGNSTGARIAYHDDTPKNKRLITAPKANKEFLKFHKNLNDDSGGIFSDLTSVLLVNKSSVDDLNKRVTNGTNIPFENFRPSILVEGPQPYEEDRWDWIKIGDAIFRNVKPCTRCVMTTINQDTGLRNEDREPLNSLSKYRKLRDILNIELEGDSPVMGAHLDVQTTGVIKTGDKVYIG